MGALKKFAALVVVGFVVGSFAVGSTEAVAQSRTVTVDAPEVSAAVTGLRVAFLTDGGCTVQAEVSRRAEIVNALAVQPEPRAARAAVCGAALNAARAAARLDFGVGDGGVP